MKSEKRKGSKKRDFSRRYDIVGNIAVIDAAPKYAKQIAAEVMKANKNVQTVLRKGGAISGKYRTRKHIYVMGKKNYVAQYKENDCTFKVDLRKCFFSTRLAFERQRIANLVTDQETVLVMFAGVGPFAIEIAKKHKGAKVIGVELNKDAHAYMNQNIKLNKLQNVKSVHADVKTYSKKHRGIADRIIMPLPMSSSKFLDSVYSSARRECTVHYYSFGDANTAYADSEALLQDYFSRRNADIKIIGNRVVRPYSANTIEVAIDFILTKGNKRI